MAEENSSKDDNNLTESINLSDLENFSFGPAWSNSDRKTEKKISHNSGNFKSNRDFPRKNVQKNRRDFRTSNSFKKEFVPSITASFYPEDLTFRKLSDAIKKSCKTYDLFELSRLILEKPERYFVNIKRKFEEGKTQLPLYVSIIDNLPFELEEDAINHAVAKQFDHFFESESIDVEKPKGNFLQVNRCATTGELLAPPNYHLYQQILMDHYKLRIQKISFERFVSNIEVVKEPEVISEWVEKMAKKTRYTLKEIFDDNVVDPFENFENARKYLLTNFKPKLVKELQIVRLFGKHISDLKSDSNIRRSIELALSDQVRFPLDTSNHIKSRLIRDKLFVGKAGKRQINYVCAVRRKFRNEKFVFNTSIQSLLEFIEKHKEISRARLPKEFLNIKLPQSKQNKNAADSTIENEDTLSTDDEMRLKQLQSDLRWLITEGYVVEFSNGILNADPPRKFFVKPYNKTIIKKNIVGKVDEKSADKKDKNFNAQNENPEENSKSLENISNIENSTVSEK